MRTCHNFSSNRVGDVSDGTDKRRIGDIISQIAERGIGAPVERLIVIDQCTVDIRTIDARYIDQCSTERWINVIGQECVLVLGIIHRMWKVLKRFV
jgi:hypothetical protein